MSINRPKREHKPIVLPDGRNYKAKCACGWEGVTRLLHGQAMRDGMDHSKRARGA